MQQCAVKADEFIEASQASSRAPVVGSVYRSARSLRFACPREDGDQANVCEEKPVYMQVDLLVHANKKVRCNVCGEKIK